MKLREEYTCPLELTHDIIKGINQKMLLEQLKELSDFGVVTKKAFEGYPLKVE